MQALWDLVLWPHTKHYLVPYQPRGAVHCSRCPCFEKPLVHTACHACCLPSCSYPFKAHDTIPNSLATLYNWICLVVAVIIVELLLFKRQHSLTVGLTGVT